MTKDQLLIDKRVLIETELTLNDKLPFNVYNSLQ